MNDKLVNEIMDDITSEKSMQIIREALTQYLEEDKRVCDECGIEMTKGYCINGGCEYFCSKNCLNTKYTDKEFEEMYDNGNSDTYYTEWED